MMEEKIEADSPLNILIALPNDTLGGAEQYLRMVANYFANQNFLIHVCFLKKQKDFGWVSLDDYNNVRLHYTTADSERAGVVSFIKKLISLRHIRFEYIFTSHVHITGIIGLLIRLGYLNKRYFVGRESTSIFIRFTGFKLLLFKLMYWMGYNKLDLLICQTNYMKVQLVRAMPWLGEKLKIEVVPNPIDLSLMQLGDTSNEGLDSYGEYIVSAGRLIPEKGFDILISVFKQLLSIYPNLNLVILGEGRERNALTQLATDLKIKHKVFLIGFVNDVYKYFKNSQACVISSRIEGFPNVLLQMMSQNDRVVSTKCAGGIDEIEGIVTAETENEDSLKLAITKALSTDISHIRPIFDKHLQERTITQFVKSLQMMLSH